MPVIATVDDGDIDVTRCVAGAFVNGEVRGTAPTKYVVPLEENQIYLMVYSNLRQGEKVAFKLYDQETEMIYDTEQSLRFDTDDVAGSVKAPVVLTKKIVPIEYSLSQNYPNPFNPVTTIRFGLPEASDVTIQVFDLLGREVITLRSNHFEAGYHEVTWNGKDRFGVSLASGLYLVRMSASFPGRRESFVRTRKMLLLK